jgi:hypothetical protein
MASIILLTVGFLVLLAASATPPSISTVNGEIYINASKLVIVSANNIDTIDILAFVASATSLQSMQGIFYFQFKIRLS